MNIHQYLPLTDRFAFEQVFLQWHGKVYGYFLSRIKDCSDARELTQQTFIKLWDSRFGLSPDLPFESQLFRISRCILVDHYRTIARRKKLQEQFGQASADSHINPLYETDLEENINEALETLPPVRKKVFLLNRLHGLSYKQIAYQLDISDRTVEKHISMALKQLRKTLVVARSIF